MGTVEKLGNDIHDVNHNTQAGSGNEKSISDDYGYSDYSDNFHTINMRGNHNQKTENESDNHITSVPERKISNKNIDTDISKTVEKLEKQDEFLILLKNESNDVNHNNTKKLNLMTISDTKAGSENEKSISNDNENLNKNIRTNEATTSTTTPSSSTPTPRLPSTHGNEAIKGKTETSVDITKADKELKSNNALSQKLNLLSEHTSESIHNDAHDENINDAFVYEELLKNDYSDYSDSFHTTKMMKKHQNKSKKEKTIYNSNSFSRENQPKK